MWRVAFRKVGALLAGLVAATLTIELGFQLILATPLRWMLPLPQIALYGPDAETGYRHRANVSGLWLTEHRAFIRTSNLGLRDRDRDIAHGKTPRAIIVGDSFIEALQVDWSATSAAVAEQILVRDLSGAEVVNLGLSGARPAVEVARLQSQGLALTPDVAVVVLLVEELLSPFATDDSEFTGYRRGGDGEFHLSYGFRVSRGYHFRTSLAGQLFYWLLDHSQVMRAVNDRKNVGLLAEWSQPPARQTYDTAWGCSANAMDSQLALWVDGKPADGRAVLDAFIRDLAAIGRSNRLPITVATRGIEARCPSLEKKRAALIDAIRTRLETAGLLFADLDARVLAKVGRDGVAPLHGFGAALGFGHLNVDGNRVYGEIFADAIRAALPVTVGVRAGRQ
jgi:hypothetical protein